MTACIIHIGMHKTGSSSIQNSLNGYNDDDFIYANINNDSNHSLAIYSLFSPDPATHPIHKADARNGSSLKKYLDDVENGLRASIDSTNGKTLIVSGEDIGVLPETSLLAIKEYFQKFFDEIMIVAYVRPPAGFITSAFQQRVKAGRMSGVDVFSEYRSYKNRFLKFDKVFGADNVQLWKFDPGEFNGGCVVQDFCYRLGINLHKEKIVRTNESLSRNSVSLLYIYNKFKEKLGYDHLRAAAATTLTDLLAEPGDEKFRFSPDVIKPVLERNKLDIQWMENRLGESLYENLDTQRPNDVCDEASLLKISPGLVDKLYSLLGGNVPESLNGESAEDIAVLFHAFRKHSLAPVSRLNHVKIVRAEADYVFGWAIGNDYDTPVQVALLINGNEVSQTVADKMRKGLLDRGLHPTGHCGFIFRLDSQNSIMNGDEIVVTIVDDGAVISDQLIAMIPNVN